MLVIINLHIACTGKAHVAANLGEFLNKTTKLNYHHGMELKKRPSVLLDIQKLDPD